MEPVKARPLELPDGAREFAKDDQLEAMEMGDSESYGFIGRAEVGSLSQADAALRKGFVRKVYGILTAQLLLTACVAAPMAASKHVRAMVLASPAMTYVALFGSLGLLFALFAYKERHPLNMQLLCAWTLMQAYSVGVVCAMYADAGAGGLVVQALFLTAFVFVGLTLFAWQSKIDFSFLGAGLGAGLWLLLLWGLFGMMFGGGGALYSLFGAGLFCGYVLFDTWLIMKKLGCDDYILGAIMLYLDIVNLFLFILQLLGDGRRE